MSPLSADDSNLSIEDLQQIRQACLRFETAWNLGQTPDLREFLDDVDDRLRSHLFRELLSIDIEFRRMRSLERSESSYKESFPEFAEVVGDVFAATAPPPTPIDGADQAQFPPGKIIANQFQIIQWLGKGGMGEVYKAIKLAAPDASLDGNYVVLKFLKDSLAQKPQFQAMLFNEVTNAQKVTHRHVCRVHDQHTWQVAEGRTPVQFVAMEYVEGETLRAYLDRNNSLPYDQKLQITKQILAGLNEAHRRKVIHRDLKPENAMIGFRDGAVRIMDFGLAVPSADEKGRVGICGTIPYIAPEIYDHKPATVRSDIYSLGKILYELFAGKRADEVGAPSEIENSATIPPAPPPSKFANHVDPRVDQAILRCLEPDPHKRPRSIPALAAVLLGDDFEAFAEKEGIEITPDILPETGRSIGWKPRRALGCLAGLLAALAILFFIKGPGDLVGVIQLPKQPSVLAWEARELLEDLGYKTAGDHTYGFDKKYSSYIIVKGVSAAFLPLLQPPAITFWYRQSPKTLTPNVWLFDRNKRCIISPTNPPFTEPEMLLIRLDPKGRLCELRTTEKGRKPGLQKTPWLEFLKPTRIGFDLNEMKTEECSDVHSVWTGQYPDTKIPIRVEAEADQGKLVRFNVQRTDVPFENSGEQGLIPYIVLFWVVVAVAVPLAVHNLRNKKADLKGTFRIGILLFGCFMLHWLLAASHNADVLHETFLLTISLASGLLVTVIYSACYLALEPFARRLWPASLTSWSRFLAGQWREPVVGQHILLGALLGGIFAAGAYGLKFVARAAGAPLAHVPNASVDLHGLLGAPQLLAHLPICVGASLVTSLTALALLLILRKIIRNRWLAGAVFVAVLTTSLTGLFLRDPEVYLRFYFSWIDLFSVAVIALFLLTRFGFLSVVVFAAVARILMLSVITSDMTSWYAGGGLFLLAVIAGIGGYGCWIAVGNKQISSQRLVDSA